MNTRRAATAASALVALALVSAGCAAADPASSDGAPATDDCTYVVGFSDPAGSQETDQIYQKALQAYGPHVGICFSIADAGLDVNKQVQDINTFVAQEVDAIIAFPLSPGSLDAALTKAQDAGIKTIGLSALVTDTQPTAEEMGPWDALFDQNSAIGGAKILSDYLADEIGDGTVLGVGLSLPVPSLQAMVANYESFLTESGATWLGTVENPTDDIAGGQQVVGEAVTRFQGQKIDAVAAYNTSSAVGAAQALRTTDSSDAIIVGQNGDAIGIEALESGQIDATTDLMPWRTALQIADLTIAVLEGGDYPALTFGRTVLYTAENLDERLDWDEAVAQIASGELTCENAGCTTGEEAERPY